MERIFEYGVVVLGYGVVMILLGAILGWAVTSIARAFDSGREIYEEKYLMCHGKLEDGKGPGAAISRKPPINFSSSNFWDDEDVVQMITNSIKNRRGEMPTLHLTSEEVNAVIDYMSRSFKVMQ
jgi:hypothetical protein